MTIRIEAYDRLPDAARAIREQVFIRERDWRPEFDEWDAASVHLLVFDSDNDAPNRPGSSAQLASRCVLASWRPLCERCFSAV